MLTYFWLVVIVVMIIIEASTFNLVTIWFAIGAVGAFLVSLVSDALWLQILVFFLVSVALLFFTRPLVKKYVNDRKMPTNSDRFVGEKGLVIEDIDVVKGTGLVKSLGQIWSAKSIDGKVIKKDSMVDIKEISGVKLIVDIINEEGV